MNKAVVSLAYFFILFLLIGHTKIFAQHIVHTSGELITLLSEDKDQGIILLDGDLFSIANLDVKAGGMVKPIQGRTPVLMGFHQKVSRGNRSVDRDGYWNIPIIGYGATQIVFLDEKLEAIPYSCRINGMNGFDLKEEQIKIIKKEDRTIGIPIPEGFDYLKNRDKLFYKNFSIKISYWFIGFELWQMYSDDDYIYGKVDNKYNFELLSIRPYSRVRVEFFNLPKAGDGVYLDGNDILHVPSEYETVYVCTTPPILKLSGSRTITFDNLLFTGANNEAIVIQGSNKNFINCVFQNCGKGIVGTDGSYSNCTIKSCRFENLYNSDAIKLRGVNNVVIDKNTINNTGLLLKGGAVISVAGLNFKLTENKVTNFSYIGISTGSLEQKKGTISGIISGNVVDNYANYGKANNQLDDGGGIYVITHTDGVVIDNNIVRNIGYDNAWMHGIYLDDGAYNVTVKYNLIYNINDKSKAIYARYVEETERSCMNNVFEGNICIGNCVMAGNLKGFGRKTVIKYNFIDGSIENSSDEHISLVRNHTLNATAQSDIKIRVDKRAEIKKRKYSRLIRDIISN